MSFPLVIDIDPSLSIQEQVNALLLRGLVADRDFLANVLEAVHLYRLCSYLYPFQQEDGSFFPGTSFEHVWQTYLFDRDLRLLVLDAIEQIEIAVLRTHMVGVFASRYGNFGYRDSRNFDLCWTKHYKFLEDIDKAVSENREPFVRPFHDLFGSMTYPPLWITAELLSFSTLRAMFCNLKPELKSEIVDFYGVQIPVFESWLKTLNVVRNHCAHHKRLWNRRLRHDAPKIPFQKYGPSWYLPTRMDNETTYCVLTILQYLTMRLSSEIAWQQHLENLIQEYPTVSLTSMGFIENWRDCPIWKGS